MVTDAVMELMMIQKVLVMTEYIVLVLYQHMAITCTRVGLVDRLVC